MGKIKKKGQSGAATNYITRSRALKKLQLNLKDFRRLCILKGIYPHEPTNKNKVTRGKNPNSTFYYIKDIQFLAHEPIIKKFREYKVFVRKLKKAKGKNDEETANRLHENKPSYKLDNIVKERYPTFVDALRDLDDALCLCFLFATFPVTRVAQQETIDLCWRLTVEFMHYIIETRSLRKVFISVKGYYYQAEVRGQLVSWVVPHHFGFTSPTDVDFKIMATFVDFYTTLLGFVNFRLYHTINLFYPPKINAKSAVTEDVDDDAVESFDTIASLNIKLRGEKQKETATDEEIDMDEFPDNANAEMIEQAKRDREKMDRLRKLFEGFKFFISREVPREPFAFVIRCIGGEVSWDSNSFAGSTFPESDETITHQLVDRPDSDKKYLTRYYIQPQWVFDCVNSCTRLPVQDYFPGVVLPPHFSPFVQEADGDYVSPDKLRIPGNQSEVEELDTEVDELQKGIQTTPDVHEEPTLSKSAQKKKQREAKAQLAEGLANAEVSSKKAKMTVKVGKVKEGRERADKEHEIAEEKKMAVMSIPKKKRRLYEKIVTSQKRKSRKIEVLKEKRATFEEENKKSRRVKK